MRVLPRKIAKLLRTNSIQTEPSDTHPVPVPSAVFCARMVAVRADRASAALEGGDYYLAGRDRNKEVWAGAMHLLMDLQWLALQQKDPKFDLVALAVAAKEAFEAERAHEMVRAQIAATSADSCGERR